MQNTNPTKKYPTIETYPSAPAPPASLRPLPTNHQRTPHFSPGEVAPHQQTERPSKSAPFSASRVATPRRKVRPAIDVLLSSNHPQQFITMPL
jgi:hypothetical protein